MAAAEDWLARFPQDEVADLTDARLVHHGTLHRARGPLAPTVRFYFLFEDQLLTAEVRKASNRRPSLPVSLQQRASSSSLDDSAIPLSRRKVFALDSVRLRLVPDDPTRFDLIQTDFSKTTTLIAGSAAARHAWVAALWRQIWQTGCGAEAAEPHTLPPPLFLAIDSSQRAAAAERANAYAAGA
eukprot:4450897-Prymnesium_polylepis.1